MAEREGRSPWFYVIIGCGGILLIFGLAVGVLFVVVFKGVRDFKAEMSDPVARASRAERLLGTDRLPEGYFVGPVFSLPFLVDLAILTDREPRADGDLAPDTESLFVYLKLIRGGHQWEDYVEGRADPFEMLEDQGFQLDRGDRVASDELAIGDQQILYVTERGSFESDDMATDEGLLTLMFIRCPEDKKMRIGVWIAADPDADRPVDEVDFTGSIADPEAVRGFMSGFRTCDG